MIKDIGEPVTGNGHVRVLQVGGGPKMGGVEKQLLTFLQRYDHKKFSIDVACLTTTEGPLRSDYLATSARLILCQWSSYIVPFIWRLYRLLRREKYDVVHVRLSEVNGAAILAAKLAGVAVRISSYHHTMIHWRRPGLMNRLVVGALQWFNRLLSTKILGNAEASLQAYYPDWRDDPSKFGICYNGFDVERFTEPQNSSEVRRELGLPIESLVVGHVGGFVKSKNHKGFINIAEHILRQIENVYFLLVGDGEFMEHVKLEVKNRDLMNRFVFTGNRNDVPRMLAVMDIFAIPSFNEGFPSGVVEAQLSGLVAVGSDIPGIREVLCPAMHKFCRAPNDFHGFAREITYLLKDSALRATLSRQGKQWASERFCIDKTVRYLESIYSSQAIVGDSWDSTKSNEPNLP